MSSMSCNAELTFPAYGIQKIPGMTQTSLVATAMHVTNSTQLILQLYPTIPCTTGVVQGFATAHTWVLCVL